MITSHMWDSGSFGALLLTVPKISLTILIQPEGPWLIKLRSSLIAATSQLVAILWLILDIWSSPLSIGHPEEDSAPPIRKPQRDNAFNSVRILWRIIPRWNGFPTLHWFKPEDLRIIQKTKWLRFSFKNPTQNFGKKVCQGY